VEALGVALSSARPDGGASSGDAARAARAAQLAAERHWMQRRRVVDALWFAAGLGASLGGGLFAMAWAVHVTDARLGRALLYAGLAFGSAGVLASTIRWLARAVDRGDAHW
jgi:hypothetical protein